MEEELISFETAVLAKEKGFDLDCKSCYEDSNYLVNQHKGDNWNQFKLQSAPTQSLLQKWLREVHSIDVLVDKGFLSNKYSYEVLYKNNMLDSEYIFKTFEKALEIGLYEALKLI